MLLRYKADIEARGTLKYVDQVIEGCTPMWAAAASGHLDVQLLKSLIERNTDVDAKTLTNSTPLRAAAYDGRLNIVNCLVENGAYVDARNNTENTPLIVACYNEPNSNYNFRQADFSIPRYEIVTYGKHSIRYLGPRLWTKLPKSIREVTTLMSFKGMVRQLNISELLDDGCAGCSLCTS